MDQPKEANATFNVAQIIVLSAIFVIGILLRFIGLDERPVHHDESLHLMYGRYFFDWPDIQYYKYSAMLHGPLLYNALRAVYDTLGSSTWAGRAFCAALGTIFMMFPLLFRRHFSNWMLVTLCGFFALSPSLIYWARFIREDTPQVLLMALTVIGAVVCRGSAKTYVIAISAALQFCEKENSYVCLALLVGFIIYEYLYEAVAVGAQDPSDHSTQPSLAVSFGRYCRTYAPHVLLSGAIFVLIYCYFYSAGFRYEKGILDGVYRESLAYWFDQHQIERIPGPFLFHFFNLSWYETAFILVFFIQFFLFYRHAGLKVGALAFGFLLLSIAVSSFEIARLGKTAVPFDKLKPWDYFHLKKPIEIVALMVLIVQPIIVTTVHLVRKEKVLAFWGYYFWASFFTYSFLGEKVPWLSIYIQLPGLVYFALYFDRYLNSERVARYRQISLGSCLRWLGVVVCLIGLFFVLENKEAETWSGNNALTLIFGVLLILLGYADSAFKLYPQINLLKALAIIGVLYTLRIAYMTNFTHSGSAVEYFSQVHTTKEFHNFVMDVRRQAESPTRSGVKPTILAEGECVWPITWYLIDIPEYKFSATPDERKNFDYIFENHVPGAAVPEGFCSEVLALRSWFVPDWDQVTLKGYLIYLFNRRPWNGTGSTNVTALVKNPNWQSCPRTVANAP